MTHPLTMEDANFCSKQRGEWHSPGAIWAAQLFALNKKPGDAQYQLDAYLNYACALGCEGIVSKRVGSLDQGQEPGGAAVRRKIGHSACAEQETDNPLLRMTAIFCKVENWSRNGLRVELMLYAGNNLDKARRVFERTHRKRTTTSMRTIS